MPQMTLAAAILFGLATRRCSSVTLAAPRADNAAVSANLLTKSYFWPSGRGHVGHYSASSARAPSNLSGSLAWTWHDPFLRYRVSPVATALDDQQNIYLTALDGIRKFDVHGTLLWHFTPVRLSWEEFSDAASVYGGRVFCSNSRRVFALSMETGNLLWSTAVPETDTTYGWVTAFDNVVLTSSGAWSGGLGDEFVTGLNASDGTVLWNFKPDARVWNFIGSFAGDGTFVFQDSEGRAYRSRLSDGQLLWKSGGMAGTWTDGSALLGPNDVVYAVNTRSRSSAGPDAPGDVSAYRLKDGQLLWRTTVPRPPNSMPAIGRLAGRTGLSLVQPIGQAGEQGAPADVYALDAATGKVQWIFNGPAQAEDLQAGDSILLAQLQRGLAGVRTLTQPNSWSAPSVDAAGTVFIGSGEGRVYALRDADRDGRVLGHDEVSSYDTGACFSGSSSPAIGRNIMAVASIDALYVFKH